MPARKKTKEQETTTPAKKAVKKVAAKKRVKINADDFLLEDPLAYGNVVVGKKFDASNIAAVLQARARAARESINKVTHMSKSRPVTLARPSTLRSRTVPFDEPYLEWMFGSSGFHTPKTWEIVAPWAAGKSTWAYTLAGKLMLRGFPVLYLECENKRMDTQRAMQLLHPDKETAKWLFNAMMTNADPITTLMECDNYMETHLPTIRAQVDADPNTAGLPIYVIIDTWTALKSAAEAKGTSDYGLTATSKVSKAKDVGEASNLGHAQYSSAYRRHLPERADKFNANFIFMTHQQEKINMNAIPGMPPTPQWKNDTSRGGRGIKSAASYVMTITPAGSIVDSGRKQIGQRVCMALTKNSYGPPFRRCYASIYWDGRSDTETTHADWFTFADETARWMADEKILSTTVRSNLYTCDALGCAAVPPEVLYRALMADVPLRESVMARLGVTGYAISPQSKMLAPITDAVITVKAFEVKEAEDEDVTDEESTELNTEDGETEE